MKWILLQMEKILCLINTFKFQIMAANNERGEVLKMGRKVSHIL